MNPSLNGSGDRSAVRCFVLHGEDTVSREQGRGTLIAAIEGNAGPCSREPFDPSAEPAALFAQRMLTPSLLQETRIFHIRHAQEMADEDLAEIDTALSGGIEGVYTIIEIDAGKRDAARILKKLHIDERMSTVPPAAQVFEFEKPAGWKIREWLAENVPKLIGRKIAPADAEYLAERVGTDLDTLHSELQKIDLYLPPAAPVTRAAIDHLAATERLRAPFELAAALGRRDFPLALKIVHALFSVTVYLPVVISALSRHFLALFRIKKFLAANPAVGRRFAASRGWKNREQIETGLAIGKAAGLIGDGEERKIFPVLIKSGIMEQAAGFSEGELSRIIEWLLEFDMGVKTGKIEPTCNNLQMLSYRIVRVRQVLETVERSRHEP